MATESQTVETNYQFALLISFPLKFGMSTERKMPPMMYITEGTDIHLFRYFAFWKREFSLSYLW
jgi:hypothetical protein